MINCISSKTDRWNSRETRRVLLRVFDSETWYGSDNELINKSKNGAKADSGEKNL